MSEFEDKLVFFCPPQLLSHESFLGMGVLLETLNMFEKPLVLFPELGDLLLDFTHLAFLLAESWDPLVGEEDAIDQEGVEYQ